MDTFNVWYETYFKRVYAYILVRVKDASVAEDLCASAWRKAYEKLNAYHEEKGNFSQWIFAIARNEVNMYWRWARIRRWFSLAPETEELLPAVEKSPLQQAEEKALKSRLLAAAEKLSVRERDIISLKFYSGLNNRQIAALSGLSESNVGTLLQRAVQKMRKDMEEL